MTLIYLTLCWVLGIVSAYLSHQRLPYGVMGFVFGACFCFVWPHPRYRRLAMLAACGACFAFGGWRLEIARPMRSDSHVVHLNNQGVVTLYGVVRREPQVYDSYTNVLIEVDEALALGRMEKRQGQ